MLDDCGQWPRICSRSTKENDIYIWGGLKVQYDGICMLVIKVGYTYLQPLDGHFECIIQRTST